VVDQFSTQFSLNDLDNERELAVPEEKKRIDKLGGSPISLLKPSKNFMDILSSVNLVETKRNKVPKWDTSLAIPSTKYWLDL